MLGAVMPFEVLLRHGECQAVIKKALKVIVLGIVLVGLVGFEEAGGRQLFRVTDYDSVICSGDSADSLTCRKL